MSTPRPGRFTPENRPGTHCKGDWVDLRAGLDERGKSRPHRDSIPGPSSMTVIDTNLLNLHHFQIVPYREHCVLRLQRPADNSSIFNGVPIVSLILNTNFGENGELSSFRIYEGWNFNSGNYLFTTDTK